MNRGKQLKLWILTVWVLVVSGLAWLIAFRPASAEAPEEYLKWATARLLVHFLFSWLPILLVILLFALWLVRRRSE